MNNLKFKLMTKKNLFLVALAAVAFAACSDDFADAPPVVTPINEEAFEKPIVFNSSSSTLTRANYTGATAADMLGGEFVVTGYKGPTTAWNSTDSKIVFDNFLVKWTENTANTTESNTSNWEYVGKGPIAHAHVTQQAIKYWDYTQPQYDFIAWSTGKYAKAIYSGIPDTDNHEVLVSAINPEKATDDAVGAYTFTGAAADLSHCYIADLVTVKKDGTETGAYGQPVVLTFRSLGTKVRIGIYETIPGYSVKDVQFYSAAATADPQAAKAMLFTTSANEIFTNGTYTVYFKTVDKSSDPAHVTPTPATDTKPAIPAYDADNNQAHIKFSGSGGQTTKVEWGGLNYTLKEDAETDNDAVYLGRSSNTASFAGVAADNYYVYFLPNETGTNLNLRVNYTLESIDGTGETIVVKGATAQVPSIYAQWQPGFAYTYLFKISDKTNGFTGAYDPTKPDDITYASGPAGLYPITFDAVVVNSEDAGNTQETITTVSAPSITTYQNGSNVVNNDEYTVLKPSGAVTGEIYVTVNESSSATLSPDLANSTLQTLTTSNAALYSIPEGKTEADVVDALQIRDEPPTTPAGITIMGRNQLPLSEKTLTLTNKVQYGVDGNEITLTANQAAKFVPTAGTTYAFVYTKTASTAANDIVKYQPVAFDASVKTKYRFDFINPAITYTDPVTSDKYYDVKKGETYFTYTDIADVTTYTKKATVFLGQRVNGLFTRSGSGTTSDPYTYAQASGYAVSGTTYYYTLDGGVTYEAATAIAYSAFGGASLFTDPNGRNAKGAETTPIDGVAYYTAVTGGYNYCVIYPEQANTMKQVDTNTYVTAEDTEIPGMTYFDKYVINDGEYYVKIIKVQ